MRIIRGIDGLSRVRAGRPGAVTIGNFDGVHRGHQAIIERMADFATKHDLRATVIIFEPQPTEFFAPNNSPARLTRLSEKLRHLSQLQLEQVLVITFNQKFAALPAEAFVSDVLVQGLETQRLFVGDDFQFGRNREGNFALLETMGKTSGFEVVPSITITHDGGRISSTRIRQCLAAHDFELAAALLGRPYTIQGRVVHGRKAGREIGMPTANINLGRRVVPVNGIFAVKVHGIDAVPLLGSAYVGTRPVISENEVVLEVHIFDFDREIYGARIEVEFVAFIRGDEHFSSMEELRVQIEKDNKVARRLFSSGENG